MSQILGGLEEDTVRLTFFDNRVEEIKHVMKQEIRNL